jgi:RNA polymerase sigma-32 factor
MTTIKASGLLGNSLLREASRQPILDHDEERRLARRSEAGDVEASSRLIASHLRFVIKIARGYRSSGLPMADLVQEGTIGLIHAVRKFDPDRDVRLSTYAMWWIKAAIQDYTVRSWSLVRIGTTNAQKALFLRLRQMTAELVGGAGELSDELATNLAKSFNTTATEVATLARRVRGRDWSLDQPRISDDGDTKNWIDCLVETGPDPEQSLTEVSERQFLGEMIDKALAMLPPREQLIIRKRYFEEVRETFEAIGREIGLSKDRVRQLEVRALATLRDHLGPIYAGISI